MMRLKATLAMLMMAVPLTAPADPSLDAQIEDLLEEVRGLRVGVITNPTGIDSSLELIADTLHADPSIEVLAFFAPEHGLRGDRQAGGSVTDYVDSRTGIPVYSIYGSRNAPTAAQLASIDALIFDIQDVGVRYYTYVWTMTHCMEAAAANDVRFIVFDRPNPIGADRCEGSPNPSDYGLIGRKWPDAPFGVATRHGMTPGEFAQLVNEEWMSPSVELTVIEMPGYTRRTTFESLGREWVLPSPNMPTIDTAYAYIATCVFEQTNLSEGRGTTRPFELIGAPFINSNDWADDLNAVRLPGVRFRAASFTPTFDDHANTLCHGVQLHVLDRETYDPQLTGLWMLKTLHTRYGAQLTIRTNAGRFFGVSNLANLIATQTPEQIIASWQSNLAAFRQIREAHLIYPAESEGAGIALLGD